MSPSPRRLAMPVASRAGKARITSNQDRKREGLDPRPARQNRLPANAETRGFSDEDYPDVGTADTAGRLHGDRSLCGGGRSSRDRAVYNQPLLHPRRDRRHQRREPVSADGAQSGADLSLWSAPMTCEFVKLTAAELAMCADM